MKKFARSAFAVLLALCMVLSTALVGSAKSPTRTDLLATSYGIHSPEDADAVQYPAVILPGLSFSKMYALDENGERMRDSKGEVMSSGVAVLDKQVMIRKAIGLIIPLVRSIFLQKDSGFSDKVMELITYATQYELNDKNGNPLHALELETYDYSFAEMDEATKQYYYDNMPLKEYGRFIGEDMLYVYTYNPFGEVMEQSAGLVDYVDMVLEQTGAEKVNIITMSMGTTVLDAFLDLPETDYSKLNRLVNLVPIFDGNEVITELLAKEYVLDDYFYACEYLPNVTEGLLGNRALGYAATMLMRLLPSGARSAGIESLYDGVCNALKYSSQSWTMVKSDRYADLRSRYLCGEGQDELRADVDRFFEAQSHVKANLKKAHDEYGVGVYNLVGYGTHSLEYISSLFSIVRSDAHTNADCLVPLSSTSLGATYCNRDEVLSDNYIASLETKKYVSPDKTVDASTCLFRDTTWFYYQQVHWTGGNDAVVNLAWLLATGIVKDINSDPENYPQFNGTRDTLDATDKYMYLAEEVLRNADAYAAKKVEAVRKAFEAMKAVYAVTNLNFQGAAEQAKAAADALGNALADLGLCDAPEKVVKTPILEKILKRACERDYARYGRKGYFEK